MGLLLEGLCPRCTSRRPRPSGWVGPEGERRAGRRARHRGSEPPSQADSDGTKRGETAHLPRLRSGIFFQTGYLRRHRDLGSRTCAPWCHHPADKHGTNWGETARLPPVGSGFPPRPGRLGRRHDHGSHTCARLPQRGTARGGTNRGETARLPRVGSEVAREHWLPALYSALRSSTLVIKPPSTS